jgi:hypothetical protein
MYPFIKPIEEVNGDETCKLKIERIQLTFHQTNFEFLFPTKKLPLTILLYFHNQYLTQNLETNQILVQSMDDANFTDIPILTWAIDDIRFLQNQHLEVQILTGDDRKVIGQSLITFPDIKFDAPNDFSSSIVIRTTKIGCLCGYYTLEHE